MTEQAAPVNPEIQKAYTAYMTKCAEVGQLDISLAGLENDYKKGKQEIEIKKHNAIVDADKLGKEFNELVKAQQLADQQAKTQAPTAVQ